jgi:hypothetical protein
MRWRAARVAQQRYSSTDHRLQRPAQSGYAMPIIVTPFSLFDDVIIFISCLRFHIAAITPLRIIFAFSAIFDSHAIIFAFIDFRHASYCRH